MFNEKDVAAVGQVLVNSKQDLTTRFRALFTLRNLGGPEAIKWISQAFQDDSALLKHELAYCLGQMQDERAIPVLEDVLKDTSQEPMVRHEAGRQEMSWSPSFIFSLNKCTQLLKWSMVHTSCLIPSYSIPVLGEALGAIGNPTVLDLLKQYSEDPVIEVLNRLQ